MAIKVLHIIDSLGSGGAELLLEMTLPRAHEAGLDVRLVYLNDDEARLPGLKQAGIPTLRLRDRYHALRRTYADNAKDFGKLDAFLNGWHPDLVHGHLFSSYILTPRVARHYQVPYVLTEHSLMDPWQLERSLTGRFARYLIKKAYNRAAAVVCVSESAKQYLQKIMRIACHNSVVIDNCIADIFWKPLAAEHDRKYHVIMCGRLAEPKNHLLALNVLSEVCQLVPHLKIAIVGEGAYRQQIEARIKELDLTRNVDLVGYKPLPDVVEYLDNSRILLMPSKREGFGLALIEGLSRGIHAVLSDIDPFRPFDGWPGITISPVEDINTYSQAIISSLSSWTLIDRPILKDRFSIARHNRSLVSLYGAVLDN